MQESKNPVKLAAFYNLEAGLVKFLKARILCFRLIRKTSVQGIWVFKNCLHNKVYFITARIAECLFP